jgi:short-subunit dehydrogenase/catechol 2,3-dioxygenase-like lactoylglutathione lyase family enzyme
VRLSQVALSVADLRRSQAWYREVLGLAPAGGTNLFAGPLASMVQGLPRAASTCWWLVDRQDQFQLELFEFRSPPTRAFASARRPCDIGYSLLSFHVDDLDAALARAAALDAAPLSEPIGDPGERRCCLRDPDGVIVELMEDDPRGRPRRGRPRPEIGAVARGVRLSVPDLERSRRLLVERLGLPEAQPQLHGPEHEGLWGLEGAERQSVSVWAADFLIELVEYREPRGEPWPPGYRISDRGILNLAFGFRERGEFENAYRRFRAAGCQPNGPVLRLGPWSVVYVNDDQGFSYELLHVEPWFEGAMGFRPRSTPRLAPFAHGVPVLRRRERAFAKALVTGAGGGIGVELCRLLAEDGTALVLLDRDERALERVEEEHSGRVAVEGRACDFADLEAVDAVAAELVERHPDLDLLLACAGVDRAQSFLGLDWRAVRDDHAINTQANYVLLSRLLPAMAARGRGHVTVIASLAGLLGLPYEGSYGASKAALAALVESARAELAPAGLTFTTVFPGFVDTPMFRANAFRHTYSIPPRDAAERIYEATLARRAELSFPARERAKLALARALPPRLRDRLARSAMRPPESWDRPSG